MLGRRDGAQRKESAATLQGAVRVKPWLRKLTADICNHLQNADCGPPGAAASPLGFHRAFSRNPLYFTTHPASEVLKIGILDSSEPRSSKRHANYAPQVRRLPTKFKRVDPQDDDF